MFYKTILLSTLITKPNISYLTSLFRRFRGLIRRNSVESIPRKVKVILRKFRTKIDLRKSYSKIKS